MIRFAAIALLFVLLNAVALQQAAGQEQSPGLLSIPAVREALRPGAEFLVRAYGSAVVLSGASADGALKSELDEYFASLAEVTESERFAEPKGGLNTIVASRLQDESLAAFGSPSCSFVMANRAFDSAAENTGTMLSRAAQRWALANTRVVEHNMSELIDGMYRVVQANPGEAEKAVRTALGRQRGKLYGLRQELDRLLDKYSRMSTDFANTLYGNPAQSVAAVGVLVNPMLVSALNRAMPPVGTEEDRARRISAAIRRIESTGVLLDQTSSTGCNSPSAGILLGTGNLAGGGAPGLYQQLVRAAYLYQALWGNELASHLGVEARDLRSALTPLYRQSSRLADRIADFRSEFLPLVQNAPGKPLLEVGEISWQEGDGDDNEVVISGKSMMAWNATADYRLVLLKDGAAVRWYPLVEWEVTPDAPAKLDEALVIKEGVGASLTTGAPQSPLDEVEITLTARYQDNLGSPGEVSKVISISNLEVECAKLKADIDRLQSGIKRQSEELEVQKKDLNERLARSESDLSSAEAELARPRPGDLAARIEETKKIIKASEDVLKSFKAADKDLAILRRQLYAILPDGARFHLANELFEVDPDDPSRREAFVKTLQPHHTGEVKDEDVFIAKKKVTDGLGARFGIGLQGIGSLITMMVPGSGQYSSVVTLVQLGIGAIADSMIDPTSFLDRQALKEVSGTSSQLKAAIARMNQVGAEVEEAARELDRLTREGGSRNQIEAVDARLVRLIKDMIREIDKVQRLVRTQIENLERFVKEKKAEVEAPESEQRDREERRREVEGAIDYLTQERDALRAELEALETTRQAEIEKLNAELARAQQAFDENCRER